MTVLVGAEALEAAGGAAEAGEAASAAKSSGGVARARKRGLPTEGNFTPDKVGKQLAERAKNKPTNKKSPEKKPPPKKNPVNKYVKVKRPGPMVVDLSKPPKLGLGGSTSTGHIKTLKMAFLLLFFFLVAREVLDPKDNKPRASQILAVMTVFMILAFVGETRRAGQIAALLGLLVALSVFMRKDSQEFTSKIASSFKSIPQSDNSNGVVQA